MEEKNVSPVSLCLWTKTVWFLSFRKAWPILDMVRLFGDRKCEVGRRVKVGEMAWGFLVRYISLTVPMRGTIRHREPKTLAVSPLLLESSTPPKWGERSTITNKQQQQQDKTRQDQMWRVLEDLWISKCAQGRRYENQEHHKESDPSSPRPPTSFSVH